MKPFFLFIALLASALTLSACSSPGDNTPVSESELNASITARSESSVASDTSSVYDPGNTTLNSAILDLFYRQLDALEDKNFDDYLSLFPPSYVSSLKNDKTAFDTAKSEFSAKSSSWTERMGKDSVLTVNVTDEAEVTSDTAYSYTALFKSRYGIDTQVNDVREFSIDYSCISEKNSRSKSGLDIVSIQIDGVWYLTPETMIF